MAVNELKKMTICDFISIACQSDVFRVMDLDEYYFINEGRYSGDDSSMESLRLNIVMTRLPNPSAMKAKKITR